MRSTWTLAARRSVAVLLALAAAAGPGRAQLYAPPPTSLLVDTSIRSAAMGGAGAAVLWGEPGVWANPATLAGLSGVGWVTGNTHLFPDLDDNVVFSSQRLLLGGGGLGFSLMGQPISGLGKAKLEVGPIALPLGGEGFEPYDLSEGWGVGVSPLRLIETARKLAGMSPRSLTRYGDVTVGYQAKDSKGLIDPNLPLTEVTTYDWGVAGRLALARWWGPDAPFRLDLSGAYSQLNVLESHSDAFVNSTLQIDRTGFALHLSPAPPSERTASPPSLPWWRPGDVPELSIGLAYDHDERQEDPFGTQISDVDHYGFEALVFRLLALRVGYVSDSYYAIDGWTYGGGVTVPIGPYGSVGYQLASVPNEADLDRRFRQGWAVWIDPARIWEGAR
jgi:hypothetical protein